MDTLTSRPLAHHRSRLIPASGLAFVIGATVTILLHESSHAVAGGLLGSVPRQLPFAVDFRALPAPEHHALILLVGPLASIAAGVLGLILDRRLTPFGERPLWRLTWLWTIFTSLQFGLGHFQAAALMPLGDTVVAFTLLGLPSGAFVAASVIGWLALPVVAWAFAGPIRDLAASAEDRADLSVWSWLLGTAVLLGLMTLYIVLSPGDDEGAMIAVLAGTAAIGVFAPVSMAFRPGARAGVPPAMRGSRLGAAFLLVGLIAVNLVLTLGWVWDTAGFRGDP